MQINSSIYPLARRDDTVVDDYHGHKIADPYRWLEDPDSEETKEYVTMLNNVSRPFLDACPLKDDISRRLTELWDYPKFTCPFREGDHYFYSYNSGLQNQYAFYIANSPKDEGTVFIDPNLLSEDGTTALTRKSFTEDGTLLAYGLCEKGSDWTTIKFKRVPSGEDLPDVLRRVRYSSLAWTIDNKGIFYNMYPQIEKDQGTTTEKNQFHSLYYHVLGTSQEEDVRCVHFPENSDYMTSSSVSVDGHYLIVEVNKGCDPTNMLFYYDLAAPGAKIEADLKLIPLVDKLEAKYDFVCNNGTEFIVLTTQDAPMFKLIKIDVSRPEKKNWTTLVEEDAKAKLDWATCVAKDKLAINYMKDAKDVLQIHDITTGNLLYTLPMDIGTITGFFGREKYTEILYKFESFVSPGSIYRVDLDAPDPQPELIREIKVKDFDRELFETDQVFYPSKDGTKVPMFIVHKKGMEKNGSNPAILYGYGGFNIAMQPYFSIQRLLLFQNLKGMFVISNLRGGCEYGERWHEGGMKERKQNVFDDFIAAAEYLVANKYTSKERLIIQGGSNGGLLVGAVANQRPDLFGGVVNQVGVLDMLRYQKFTIGQAWVPEFGSSDDATEFDYIIQYSPLHNLKRPLKPQEEYPPMLLLTADHDDRVVPLHSLKYIAELYHTVKNSEVQKNPLLIRIETKAGHGAGKPTSKVIEEIVDIYAFIVQILKLNWHQ